MKLIPCSKEEFDAFVASYHRPLVRDVLRTVEPERIQYNDFTLGDWPDSVVASFSAWGCDPNDPYAATPGDWHIAQPAQAQLCERLRHESKEELGERMQQLDTRWESAALIESQAKQIAERDERVKALEAKCALLAASLVQAEREKDDAEKHAAEVSNANFELEAKVAAAEKDSTRYQWLRLITSRDEVINEFVIGTPSELDEAIDAAIKRDERETKS